MSVIARDGKTLAADKAVSYGSTLMKTVKLFKVGDSVMGYVGTICHGEEQARWVKNGMVLEEYPKCEELDDSATLILWTPQTGILMFENSPNPTDIKPNKYMAWGSGMDLALGALHQGATAEQAVKAAITHSSTCGFGVTKFKCL